MSNSLLKLEARSAARATAVTFWVVAVITLFLAFLPALERNEARYFPVVRDFRITSVDTDGAGAVISGLMRKSRDCRFVKLTVYAGDIEDPERPRERLRIRFMDQSDGDRTREPGLQNWGPWRIEAPQSSAGPDLFVRVTHDCHPAFETRGVIFQTALDGVFAPAGAADR
jgi:hypothetical protein